MNFASKTHLFEFMRQTASRVDAFIIDELRRTCRDTASYDAVSHLPSIRAEPDPVGARPKLRASFIRLVFELVSEADWQCVLPVAAVGELLAISSYVVDDFLDHQEMRDGASATWVAHGPADAVMAAQLQREISEKIILRLPLSERKLVRLVQLLNGIFCEGYLGQFMDSRMTKPCTVEDYVRRCEKIAGQFHSGLGVMAAVVADAQQGVVDKISSLGFCNGIALQIRNDVVDYIPLSVTAKAGAQALERSHFEDFRNGKWTMPLLHAYERATLSEQERIHTLMGQMLSTADTTWLLKLLHSTGGFEMSLNMITAYKEKAQLLLAEFSPTAARQALAALLECVENVRGYVQKLRAIVA
jgi:octaprenyl-diphosphate synthase